MNMNAKDLGTMIKAKRILLNLTLDDLAKKTNIHKSALSKYENGNVIMNVLTFMKICNVLVIEINFNLERFNK